MPSDSLHRVSVIVRHNPAAKGLRPQRAYRHVTICRSGAQSGEIAVGVALRSDEPEPNGAARRGLSRVGRALHRVTPLPTQPTTSV
jgi:hypothetical protein